MLPFTKRPGRLSDDQDVITKDDLVQSSEGVEPVSQERSVRSPFASVSEEEMTTLMPRASAGPALPLPAAGRPAAAPPAPVRSRPAPSVRPPPASLRSGPHSLVADDEDEDEDEGRTVVRGAGNPGPKIVKRSKPGSAPASMSPAAVIKSTLEAARSNNRRDQLMPGPPVDLLEDRSDALAVGHGHTLQSRGSQPPPSFDRMGPPSHRPPQSPVGDRQGQSNPPGAFAPPPPSSAPASSPFAARSYPPSSMSVPGVAMPASMPAHFMTPKYSDPPGTSVTASHTIAGRPALSWAVALLGCGLFVGVAAVALMQHNDGLADTTASFVDPAHAKRAPAAAAAIPAAPTAEPAAAPQPAPVPQPVVAAAAPVPAPVAAPTPVPTGVFGSTPAPAAQPAVAFAPVNVQPAPPAPKAAAPAARPVVAWKPAPAAAPPPPKPVAKAPAADEEPAPKKTAAGKKGAAKGGDGTDDETKKALEALQKAQLESASSFGDK
jgi:hypothetical protein